MRTISENVRRRHLTTGQRAAVAYESLPMFEAATAKRKARAAAEAAAKRERDERGRMKSTEAHQMVADLPPSGRAKKSGHTPRMKARDRPTPAPVTSGPAGDGRSGPRPRRVGA